jgi:serine/threonine-protein kinase
VIGRYTIYEEIAAGGMATVHYGRLMGPVGFSRPVAIKRLHPHLARDPEFVTMFLDEARLAARVRHPNVVATLDIVTTDNQLFLVMEYVQGESLARLARKAKMRNESIPVSVTVSMLAGALHGLHAAHEAKNERGEPLGIIHRDISPQNIIVGMDGVARVLDFGVAKAVGRLQTTREGQLKGKLAYMAPELVSNGPVGRAVDIYAASVVLWEMLAERRLFHDTSEAAILSKLLNSVVDPPSKYNKSVPPALDAIILKGLERDPTKRWATAREMAREIESAVPIATTSSVGEWVESLAQETLQERARKFAEIESNSDVFDRSGVSSLVESVRSGDVVVPPAPAPPAPKEGDTELSSSHLATDVFQEPEPAPAPRKRARGALLFAAIGVATLLGVIVYLAVRTPAAPPIPAAAPTETAKAAPVVSTPEVVAVDTPAARPSGAVSAPPPSATHAPTIKPKPTAPPVVKAGCNPPYTIDAQGIKKYKVDCL